MNNKLKIDLEKIKKHMESVKKNNEILKNCIDNYTQTGSKVARFMNKVYDSWIFN